MPSRAQKYAWVSGDCGYGYTLHVSDALEVRPYKHFNDMRLTDFRAAQHLANAMRVFAEKRAVEMKRVRKLVKRRP